MSDFHQSGLITTLHRLPGAVPLEISRELARPVTLVIPAHGSEFGTAAFDAILDVLSGCDFLQRFFLVMNEVSEDQVHLLRERLRGFAIPSHLVLPTSGAFADILQLQNPVRSGKGLNLWAGLLFSSELEPDAAVICHDADIIAYDRNFLKRLAFPMAHPDLDYQFAKGFYPRVSEERFYGRVTRLFVAPLLRSLIRVLGHMPLLDFLDDFRYLLAGEFALASESVKAMRVPLGWGAEIGMLAEAFRHLEPSQICQVDLGSNYQHKHQAVGTPGQPGGLAAMCEEITVTLFTELGREGVALPSEIQLAILHSYQRNVTDAIRRFQDDARYNGVVYPYAEEEQMGVIFAEALRRGCERFTEGVTYAPALSAVTQAQRRQLVESWA